jgi:diadenosine tetraphosphatase ApaH/serine/threonine PP2A family protein phosphatase
VILGLEDAQALVADATRALAAEQTLCRVDLDKVVVVGDLHGQFHDMVAIFEFAGMPSESNPYLFNGDFVDRGSNSLGVIFTLFALKLRFPHAVFLNRGNHESAHLNLRYGFAEEIYARYGPAGERLFDAFSESFRWLPLAHVLNSEVFVVHGGLPGPDPRLAFADAGGGGTGYDAVAAAADGRSGGRKGGGQHLSLLGSNPDNVSLPPRRRELSLDEIAALPRGCDPVTDLKSLDALPEEEAEVQRILVDLLWADPRGKTGYGPSFRVQKGCYIFGPDVTEAFLEQNGLRLIIRSHEVKVGGYEWTHPSLITVFSAPNYLGHARNKGAVAMLTRSPETGHLEPTFAQYEESGSASEESPAFEFASAP